MEVAFFFLPNLVTFSSLLFFFYFLLRRLDEKLSVTHKETHFTANVCRQTAFNRFVLSFLEISQFSKKRFKLFYLFIISIIIVKG